MRKPLKRITAAQVRRLAKAVALRRKLTNKALAARWGVSVSSVSHWAYKLRKQGKLAPGLPRGLA